MTERVKITPRARALALKRGLDPNRLSIAGTGYKGGICEQDIINYEDANSVRMSPLARKIAAVENVALDGITGTGAHGKLMKADVMAKVGAPAPAAAADKAPAAATAVGTVTPDGKTIREVVPYSGVRRIIGERLAGSWRDAPLIFFTAEVEMDKVVAFRKEVNAAQDVKTSITDFLILAVSKALRKYPEVNVALQGDEIHKYSSLNVGLAVAADSGLIVPVIKNTENMNVIDITKETQRLIEKARTGKLMPDEYSGNTVTISNLGNSGIDCFTAIPNPPEAGILAVSATKKRPVVRTGKDGKDEVVIRSIMNITFSADHRVIDGKLAADFTVEIRNQLENPLGLLL